MRNVVTIDGGAWTGKSTIAQALAKMLEYHFLNTGSMFRSLACLACEKGIALDDKESILQMMQNIDITFKEIEGIFRIFINNEDFTNKIKGNEIVPLASKISQIPEVRKELVKLLRKITTEGNFVIEGRDTGTVMFPDAKWKFYLTASLEIKVKRFLKIISDEEKGKYSEEEVKKIIQETDQRDKNRAVAPLKRAVDALIYDNTKSPTPEQDAIVLWYYITHSEEIFQNSFILKEKKD